MPMMTLVPNTVVNSVNDVLTSLGAEHSGTGVLVGGFNVLGTPSVPVSAANLKVTTSKLVVPTMAIHMDAYHGFSPACEPFAEKMRDAELVFKKNNRWRKFKRPRHR